VTYVNGKLYLNLKFNLYVTQTAQKFIVSS